MTGFGTLSKKLKKLEAKDLPILKSKKNTSGILQPIINTIVEQDVSNELKWNRLFCNIRGRDIFDILICLFLNREIWYIISYIDNKNTFLLVK